MFILKNILNFVWKCHLKIIHNNIHLYIGPKYGNFAFLCTFAVKHFILISLILKWVKNGIAADISSGSFVTQKMESQAEHFTRVQYCEVQNSAHIAIL